MENPEHSAEEIAKIEDERREHDRKEYEEEYSLTKAVEWGEKTPEEAAAEAKKSQIRKYMEMLVEKDPQIAALEEMRENLSKLRTTIPGSLSAYTDDSVRKVVGRFTESASQFEYTKHLSKLLGQRIEDKERKERMDDGAEDLKTFIFGMEEGVRATMMELAERKWAESGK